MALSGRHPIACSDAVRDSVNSQGGLGPTMLAHTGLLARAKVVRCTGALKAVVERYGLEHRHGVELHNASGWGPCPTRSEDVASCPTAGFALVYLVKRI